MYVKWQKLAALEVGYNRKKSLEKTWFPSREPRFFIILTEKTPSSKRSEGGSSSMKCSIKIMEKRIVYLEEVLKKKDSSEKVSVMDRIFVVWNMYCGNSDCYSLGNYNIIFKVNWIK